MTASETVSTEQRHRGLVEVPTCAVCGATERSVVQRDRRGGASAHRDLVRCGGCGFVYVSPVREQDFSALPESRYLNDRALLDLSGLPFQYDFMTSALRRLDPSRAARTRSEHRLLDVGCGAGYFLAHCRAHGWNVTGVEPWRALADWAGKYLALDVLPAHLAEAAPEAESYDVVTAHEVIQFTADPSGFLSDCFAALKPGGVVVLSTANYDCAARRRQGFAWSGILPYAHVGYFTPETLSRAARRAGFRQPLIEVAGGEDGDDQILFAARRPPEPAVTWDDISEPIDDALMPPLDRARVDDARLTPEQRQWREQGYLVLPGFMPEHLVDRYCVVRERIRDPRGWHDETPYLRVEEIRDLCLYRPLSDLLEHLIGEPMALQLNLTGWISTDRNWHQDDYLNPPDVRSHYAALWCALDDIPADCGPFEFVPGSHRWPLIRRDKVLALLPETGAEQRDWPWHTERLLTPFFEREIEVREAPVERFLRRRGDVLLWHSRLLHRGSPARRAGARRKAIIGHYSARDRKAAGMHPVQHRDQGWYFRFGEPPAGDLWTRLRRRLARTIAPD